MGAPDYLVPSTPTNDALLTNFRLSSDAEIFVNKHRDWEYKSSPNVQRCVRIV